MGRTLQNGFCCLFSATSFIDKPTSSRKTRITRLVLPGQTPRLIFSAHSVEKHIGEALRGLFLRQFNEISFMEVQANGVIVDGAEKSLDGDIGIPPMERPLALSLGYVSAQESE